MKQLACEAIDRNADKIIAIAEDIFVEPELGYKEFKTAAKVKKVFEELGIEYQDEVAITGVIGKAEGGQHNAKIAVMGELDAVVCPGHRCADPVTGAAHSCGHHAQIAFLYNYCASLLRAVGNSLIPLIFLLVSALVNIGLDLLFVISFEWGVGGAAAATVVAQGLSAVGILLYTLLRFPQLRPQKEHRHFAPWAIRNIFQYSFLTCLQQSVMNFGILMVQGLVNSFGTNVMAAFAAAVKIDSFAYMPVQDFGNAFSTFVGQNFGARRTDRIKAGIKSAVTVSALFSIAVSFLVFVFAGPLLTIFIDPAETEIIAIGTGYLRIEGAFYCGIGCLFLLYGLYRAINRPGMSVVLTIISLGTRVLLAYVLSAIPAIGVTGIWWAIPIGWILADIYGLVYYKKHKRLLDFEH